MGHNVSHFLLAKEGRNNPQINLLYIAPIIVLGARKVARPHGAPGSFCTIVSGSYSSYRVVPEVSGKSAASGSRAYQASHAWLWDIPPWMSERRPQARRSECSPLDFQSFLSHCRVSNRVSPFWYPFLNLPGLVESIVILGFTYMRNKVFFFLLMPQLSLRFAFPQKYSLPPWLLVLDAFPTGSHYRGRGNPCHVHYPHRLSRRRQ